MRAGLAALLALSFVSACKKSEPPAPATTSSAAKAPAATPTPTPPAAAPVASPIATPPGTLTIFQRLEVEAKARPKNTLRAEVVLDAIEKLSGLTKRQQYVGATVGAAYCVGGNTKSGLAISVCEYPSPEAAASGRALLETRYRTVRKELHINQATLLNVGLTAQNLPRPEETARIAEVFASLK